MGTSQNTIGSSTLQTIGTGLARIVVYCLLVVGLGEFIKWDASQFTGDAKFS